MKSRKRQEIGKEREVTRQPTRNALPLLLKTSTFRHFYFFENKITIIKRQYLCLFVVSSRCHHILTQHERNGSEIGYFIVADSFDNMVSNREVAWFHWLPFSSLRRENLVALGDTNSIWPRDVHWNYDKRGRNSGSTRNLTKTGGSKGEEGENWERERWALRS